MQRKNRKAGNGFVWNFLYYGTSVFFAMSCAQAKYNAALWFIVIAVVVIKTGE